MKVLAILAVFFCFVAVRADETGTQVPANEAVPTVTTEQNQAGSEEVVTENPDTHQEEADSEETTEARD